MGARNNFKGFDYCIFNLHDPAIVTIYMTIMYVLFGFKGSMRITRIYGSLKNISFLKFFSARKEIVLK